MISLARSHWLLWLSCDYHVILVIIQMDQADKISGSEQQALESRASVHRRTHNTMTQSR